MAQIGIQILYSLHFTACIWLHALYFYTPFVYLCYTGQLHFIPQLTYYSIQSTSMTVASSDVVRQFQCRWDHQCLQLGTDTSSSRT